MKLDKYGFPIPEGFDDEPTPPGFAPSKRSLVAVVLLAFLAAGVVFAAKFGPDAITIAKEQVNRHRADEIVEQAERWRQRGHLREAVERCSRAIDLDSDNLKALWVRAACYSQLHRYAEAAEDYGRVLEIDPDNAMALNNRAYNLALANRQLEEALADVQKALKLRGPDEAFLDTRGYLYYLLGRPEDALVDLNAAIELMSRRRTLSAAGEIYYHRALVHQKLGNRAQADADFQRAREFGFDVPLPV